MRILPAFSPDLTSDNPGFKSSFVSYRNKQAAPDDKGHLPFTSWYYTVVGHAYVGNGKRGFLSPLILEPGMRYRRGVDPICDIWNVAEKDDRFKHLVTKTEGERNSELEWPRTFGIINALVAIENQWENRAVVTTKATLDLLKDALNIYGPRGTQPVDPENDQYLLGDVTSPHYGSMATVREAVFNKAGMKTAKFFYSQFDDRLQGFQPFPLDLNNPVAQGWLLNRYDIGDMEKVTKIASADEIIDYLVSDNTVPYELIKMACENNWAVPAGHVGRTFFPGQGGQPSPAPGYAPAGQQAPGYLPVGQPPVGQPPQGYLGQVPGHPQTPPTVPYTPPAAPSAAPMTPAPAFQAAPFQAPQMTPPTPAAPSVAPYRPAAPPAPTGFTPPTVPPQGGNFAPPPTGFAPPPGGFATPPVAPTAAPRPTPAFNPGQVQPSPFQPTPVAPQAPAASPYAPQAPAAYAPPQQPPAAPAPGGAPAPASAAPISNLTPEEAHQLTELESRFKANPACLTQPEMQTMMTLHNKAAQPAA
jgi:hypothetical protein